MEETKLRNVERHIRCSMLCCPSKLFTELRKMRQQTWSAASVQLVSRAETQETQPSALCKDCSQWPETALAVHLPQQDLGTLIDSDRWRVAKSRVEALHENLETFVDRREMQCL